MFLKQEKSEMDDFDEKRTLVLKEFRNVIILRKYPFNGYPCKNVTNFFLHILLFQNILSIF